MNDEQKLKDILEKAGVYHSALWYSGAGPNERDLGAGHLAKIYDGIHTTFGENASGALVATIRGLTSLSPTVFLQALWNLFWSGWRMPDSVETPSEVALDPRRQTVQQMQLGMLGALAGLSSRSPRQDKLMTDQIRDGFLWHVRDRFPPTREEMQAKLDAYVEDMRFARRFGY